MILLGKSTFGSVYSDGKHAYKKQSLFRGSRVSSSAIREAIMLNFCNHPRIVKPLDIYIEKSDLVIKMPIYKSFKEAKDISITILTAIEGLIYLHDNDIIHGDIKPGNIMIDDNDVAVLIDFGKSVYNNLPPVGTRNYLSPENVDKITTGKEGDMWALGVTFLQLKYSKSIGQLKREGISKFISRLKITDPMLLGLLEIDPTKRWTARQAFTYMVEGRGELESYIIKKVKVPTMKMAVGDISLYERQMMIDWATKVIGKDLIYKYTSIHDYFITKHAYKMPIYKYPVYGIVFVKLMSLIYLPNEKASSSTLCSMRTGLSIESYKGVLVSVLVRMNFKLPFI